MKKNKSNNELSFSIVSPQDMDSKWNDTLEIVFILKGEGKLRLGDNETIYTVRSKDIFVINRYQLRSLSLEAGSAALAMYIPPSLLTALCPEQSGLIFECKSFLFSEEDQDAFDVIRRDFAQAFEVYYKRGSYLPVVLRSHVSILVADLAQFFASPLTKQTETGIKGFEHLKTLTEYIHKHYWEDITLSSLAAHSFLSTSHITHLFKMQLGQTFTGYLTDVRLSHAAALFASGQTITDIAANTGFCNANAFIEAFKQRYGITPGQYRKQHEVSENTDDLSSVFSDVYSTLAEYVEHSSTPLVSAEPRFAETYEVIVDVSKRQKNLKHRWRTIINAGYAIDLCTAAVRSQLEQIQREIGYKYIRIKGCLNDELMICKRARNGSELVYNFVFVDECIDFILSLGAKPWLDLNDVPKDLARIPPSVESHLVLSNTTLVKDNSAFPEKLEDLLALIKALFFHLVERYGESEVDNWIFLPFTSLTYEKYGFITKEEYWHIYTATVKIMRAELPSVKVAGANVAIDEPELVRWFLNKCVSENLIPDFLALQSFNTIDPKIEDTGLNLLAQNEALPVAVSGDENYIKSNLRTIKHIITQLNISDLPIVLSEWNSTIWQRDLCNDTSYKSAYIFKNILENYDSLYGMGYWYLSDNTVEIPPSPNLFHGGFGLFTRSGLTKSAYQALMLINKIGNSLILKGDGYFIAGDKQCIQIYLYNYAHYDTLYRYRHTLNLTFTERYNVFNLCQPRQYTIRLKGLDKGRYTIRNYCIGPDSGSVYDAWIDMGAPKIQAEVHEFLKHLSYPAYKQYSKELESEATITSLLKPHEVKLITITKE